MKNNITWRQHVSNIYKKQKIHDKNFRFGQAMKMAKKTWKKTKNMIKPILPSFKMFRKLTKKNKSRKNKH
jgi:hypothetical protein